VRERKRERGREFLKVKKENEIKREKKHPL